MSAILSTVRMLIRRPPQTVFAAFVDPATIETFWLERTSGPLAENAVVTWEFQVPGARDTVRVREFVPPERIVFAWSDDIVVTLEFAAMGDLGTRLSVTAAGFAGPDAGMQAADATEGFSLVVAELKCLLESGYRAGLVRDKALLIGAAQSTG